jgi:heat shock protein HtpX
MTDSGKKWLPGMYKTFLTRRLRRMSHQRGNVSSCHKIDAGTEELALAPDGRLTSVSHLMIASPLRADGFTRLFRTHPPAGERVRRLEALAGYRR